MIHKGNIELQFSLSAKERHKMENLKEIQGYLKVTGISGLSFWNLKKVGNIFVEKSDISFPKLEKCLDIRNGSQSKVSAEKLKTASHISINDDSELYINELVSCHNIWAKNNCLIEANRLLFCKSITLSINSKIFAHSLETIQTDSILFDNSAIHSQTLDKEKNKIWRKQLNSNSI